MQSDSFCFEKKNFTRRSFLKAGLIAAAGLTLPVNALAKITAGAEPEKRLSFYNTHTGESLKKAVFWADGHYNPESIEEINYILRDHRTGTEIEMDPVLFDLLYDLRRTLGTDKPLHIISGYRSPQTNNLLRHNSSGVAKGSLHMRGKASDIRIPGISTTDLRKAALSLKAGGVGYYPESRFVHVDTGRVRFW